MRRVSDGKREQLAVQLSSHSFSKLTSGFRAQPLKSFPIPGKKSISRQRKRKQRGCSKPQAEAGGAGTGAQLPRPCRALGAGRGEGLWGRPRSPPPADASAPRACGGWPASRPSARGRAGRRRRGPRGTRLSPRCARCWEGGWLAAGGGGRAPSPPVPAAPLTSHSPPPRC